MSSEPKLPEIRGEIKKIPSATYIENMGYDSIINEIRKCESCPLRAKDMKIGDKIVEKPAACSLYHPGRDKCPIGITDYLAKVKIYSSQNEELDPISVVEGTLINQMANMVLAEQVEIMTNGRPGYYSHLFNESVAEQARELHKLKNPNQEVNVKMSFDVALEKFRNAKKKEIIDVEFTENKDGTGKGNN